MRASRARRGREEVQLEALLGALEARLVIGSIGVSRRRSRQRNAAHLDLGSNSERVVQLLVLSGALVLEALHGKHKACQNGPAQEDKRALEEVEAHHLEEHHAKLANTPRPNVRHALAARLYHQAHYAAMAAKNDNTVATAIVIHGPSRSLLIR